MRVALWAVVIAIPSVVGAWIYAKGDLKSRFAELTHQVLQVGLERGSRIPSKERVEDRVHAAARKLGIQVVELDISIAPITSANHSRLDPAARLVEEQAQAKVRRILEVRTRQNQRYAAEGVQPFDTTSPQVPMTLIEVRGRARAKKWLWSLNKPFDLRKTIRGGAATPKPKDATAGAP